MLAGAAYLATTAVPAETDTSAAPTDRPLVPLVPSKHLVVPPLIDVLEHPLGISQV